MPVWGVHFKAPKTPKSRRQFTLTPQLMEVLQKQKIIQAHFRATNAAWRDQGLIFSTSNGTPYRAENIRRAFKRILIESGLPEKTRLHDLRHTCATLLYERVQDIKLVSDYLGHAQIGITADIYTHIFPDMKSRAVASLSDDLLGGSVVNTVVKK